MNDAMEPGVPRDSIDVVLFSAGAWRVGVEARWVRGCRGAPPQATGHEIAAWLGLEPSTAAAPTAPRQYLQLRHPNGDMEILVDGPVELHTLPATAIHALPPLFAARTRLRALQALAFDPQIHTQAVIFLFDGIRLTTFSELVARAGVESSGRFG